MADLISRQAAIDRINKQREHLQPDVYPQDKIGDAAYLICSELIERLPSAQPEKCEDCENFNKTQLWIPQPEIIRCGECKHRDKKYLCDVWDAYITNDEYYCGNAERREDEIN